MCSYAKEIKTKQQKHKLHENMKLHDKGMLGTNDLWIGRTCNQRQKQGGSNINNYINKTIEKKYFQI